LATDVQQDDLGDCWLMSSLAETAYNDPQAIKQMFHDNGNGTYTIGFYGTQLASGSDNLVQPTSAEWVTVDTELPDGGGIFDIVGVGGNTVLWAALAEKAFTEVYQAPQSTDFYGPPLASPYGQVEQMGAYTYADVNGGWPYVPLAAITGKPTTSNLNPTSGVAGASGYALAQGQLVCIGTPASAQAPLVGPHEYAVLAYDPASKEFLLYNPHGPEAATYLFAPVASGAANNTIQLIENSWLDEDQAGAIAVGDVIQIDQELMLVKRISGTSTNDWTLTVDRGLYGTTASAHTGGVGETPTGVYLQLVAGTPWTQIAGSPILNSPNEDAVFAEPAAFLNAAFADEGNTNSASAAGAPVAEIPTVAPTAANVADTLGSSPGAGPDGDLLGMPPAQATTLDPPQAEPAPVAAATAVNRLKALDAAFASGDSADQHRKIRLHSGNRSGDDTDAWFVPDELASWHEKLADLKTGPRIAST
jgi:hypothetical protein